MTTPCPALFTVSSGFCRHLLPGCAALHRHYFGPPYILLAIPRSKPRGKPRCKLDGRVYGGPSRGGAGLRGPPRPVLERGRHLYRSRTQGPKGGSSRRDRPWCSAAAASAIPLARQHFLELLGGALRGRCSAAPGGSGGRWRGWGSAGLRGRWSLRRKFCVHASPEHWTRGPTLASPAPPSDPLTTAL
jgi:hypothetical protein